MEAAGALKCSSQNSTSMQECHYFLFQSLRLEIFQLLHLSTPLQIPVSTAVDRSGLEHLSNLFILLLNQAFCLFQFFKTFSSSCTWLISQYNAENIFFFLLISVLGIFTSYLRLLTRLVSFISYTCNGQQTSISCSIFLQPPFLPLLPPKLVLANLMPAPSLIIVTVLVV